MEVGYERKRIQLYYGQKMPYGITNISTGVKLQN